MLFCPKCGSILAIKKGSNRIACSCGYSTKQKKVVIKEKTDTARKIEVVDKTIETLPITNAKCPKCGYNKAYYWLAQTRGADEPETQFFRCKKCNNLWRSYT